MSQFEFVDPDETLARNSREAGLDPDDPRVPAVRDAVARDAGSAAASRPAFGRHGASVRAGSTRSCRSRTRRCPGRVVVQWDKDDCADLGIIKVDLLGLGMMAVLEEAIDDHQRSTDDDQRAASSSEVDLAHLPPDDPAVYRMLQQADTIGVFQVESRAQMATLPRLRPSTSTTSSSRSRSSGPGRSSATWCIRIWRGGAATSR